MKSASVNVFRKIPLKTKKNCLVKKNPINEKNGLKMNQFKQVH